MPLPKGTMLRPKEGGEPFAADGLFALDGIRPKKGTHLVILDGAFAFSPVAK